MKRTTRRERSPSRFSYSAGVISAKYLPVAGSICSEHSGLPGTRTGLGVETNVTAQAGTIQVDSAGRGQGPAVRFSLR